MFGKLLFVLVALAIIWGMIQIAFPRVFLVRLAGGRVTPVKGVVTPLFVQQIRDVAAEHGVREGQVWGEARRDGRIRLGFSASIPGVARQQLRNWWATSGWRADPGRR